MVKYNNKSREIIDTFYFFQPVCYDIVYYRNFFD